MKNGAYGPFKVTEPPVTIPSFPCIFSGLTVEDLNYCTFVTPSGLIFSSNLWRDKSVLSLREIKTFSLNLPSTYPAWNINGEMVTGLLTPEINDKMCFPKDLINSFEKNWIIDGKNINEVFDAFEMKKRMFFKKLNKDFNLLIFIIRIPDCITHHPKIRLKATSKAIETGYRKIDEFLGVILDKVDYNNLFIISDHGLKLYNYEFNIKRFLEKKKILAYNNDKISKFLSVLIKILGYFNAKFFNTTFFHNKFKKFINQVKFFKKNEESSIDSTKFIHFYSNYGGIFLSQKDKEKKEIIEKVLINSKYVKKIKTYDSETIPDMIITLQEKYLFSVKSSFFVKNRFNSFNHSDKGIFIACGKNINKNFFSEVNYIDFAPTLLKLYNINKLTHMKGRAQKIFKI